MEFALPQLKEILKRLAKQLNYHEYAIMIGVIAEIEKLSNAG
jgi:hypothetical protein